MKILLFHPTLLPPKDYGGVERVVLWLAQGLLERGHEVWIAAFPQSLLPRGARLLPIEPLKSSAQSLLIQLPSGIDLVHFMAPPEDGVMERLPCAAVVTVHGNGKPGELFPKNSIFLSQDHAKRHGAQVFVYNGIHPQEYRFNPQHKNDEYLFLSKTHWSVKNLKGAMRLCSQARVPLQIAGGSRPLLTRLRNFFNPSIKWMGPVNGEKKANLLANAKALIFPVIWPEPFGLVVVEALVSGTPVLASRKGSLPELIPNEVGAILESEEEWLEMLGRKKLPWDPRDCRDWVLKKFHYTQMAENYERLYQRVLKGNVLNPIHPIASNWRTQ